jgi:hypothetical protein
MCRLHQAIIPITEKVFDDFAAGDDTLAVLRTGGVA